MVDYYETFAADYDWLFDDDALASGLAVGHPATARLLERTPPGSTVLDAACGTGSSAAALARRGFLVRATDGSDAMVTVAAARFRREHLDVPLARCLWADLPAVVGERFDVVLCLGNSLVHTASRAAMIEALTGLRQMARPGGHVVVDSRNWEKLHAERRVVRVADRAVTRDGRLRGHEKANTRQYTVQECREKIAAILAEDEPGDWGPGRTSLTSCSRSRASGNTNMRVITRPG